MGGREKVGQGERDKEKDRRGGRQVGERQIGREGGGERKKREEEMGEGCGRERQKGWRGERGWEVDREEERCREVRDGCVVDNERDVGGNDGSGK